MIQATTQRKILLKNIFNFDDSFTIIGYTYYNRQFSRPSFVLRKSIKPTSKRKKNNVVKQ